MTTILMGRPLLAMVASSGMDIWKPPSPTRAKTSLSGRANCAPMAAGRPKPMEPRPPELSHRRGSLKRMNCAAHIWCWPTSVATMAWPPERRSISAIRCCGLISVDRTSAASSGCSSFQCADLPPPGLRAAARCFRRGHFVALRQQLVELAEDALDVAHDGHVGRAVLADLGRVDIHVDHLGVRREGGQAAGDAVVEAHAQGDQQVAVGHRHVGGVAAVHAGHADEVGMLGGQAAQAHQRADGGRIGQFHELAQFGGGARRDDAAAGIDQRPLGFLDHLRRAADLAGVAFGEDLVAGQVDGGHRLVVALALKHVLGISTSTGPGRPLAAT